VNRTALLTHAGPPPYELINPGSPVPLLFVCEHAGHQVPAGLDGLGIAEADLLDHIGWDIGAGAVTRRLAAIFSAPAVLATYSRLVIDANRPLEHPASIPAESDARPIPANAGLDAARRKARQEACFWPFHRTVAAARRRLTEAALPGQPPALVFMHSFTPAMADGTPRPWEVGILYDRDERLAAPLLRFLGQTLGEKFPEQAFDKLANIRIFEGGPVDHGQLILTAWKWDANENSHKMFFGITSEHAMELIESGEEVTVRGYLGYAGWSAGQLESELNQNAWTTKPIITEVLDLEGETEVWDHLALADGMIPDGDPSESDSIVGIVEDLLPPPPANPDHN